MTNGIALGKLLSEQRYDEVESEFREALSEPVANEELLLQAARGLARAPREKNRLQELAGIAEAELKPRASDPRVARVRWNVLKEAVRGGEVGEGVGEKIVGKGEGEVEEVGDEGSGDDENEVHLARHRSRLSSSSGRDVRTRASSTVISPCRTSRASESSMVIIPWRLPRVISVVRLCSLSLRM